MEGANGSRGEGSMEKRTIFLIDRKFRGAAMFGSSEDNVLSIKLSIISE
jgi:hypothetical protein